MTTGWYVVDKSLSHSYRVDVKGDVKIILAGVCEWNAEEGIYVPANTKFTVYTQNGDSGVLRAYDTYGQAGIGGKEGSGYGDITINGGTATATGGSGGAGIGGGNESSASNILISGGTVEAIGGEGGAGIGAGRYYSNYGNSGAVSTIVIEDGYITATGGDYAAGIGNGQNGAGGSIRINGGEINAYGGMNGAGIGGAGMYNSYARTDVNYIAITINGGKIYAQGKEYGSGIGSGSLGIRDKKQKLTVNGGDITAVAGEGGTHAFAQGGYTDEILAYDMTIGNTLKVQYADKNDDMITSLKADRLHEAQFNKFVKITECEHTGAETEYTFKNHTFKCDYCNAEETSQPHEFKDGICTGCHAHEAVVTFQSTSYEGTMDPVSGAADRDYTLPETTTFDVPAGTALTGWEVDGVLNTPGAVIHVSGNITAKAQWGSLTDPLFKGHQLVLGGTLGLRFGLELPADFDSTGSYMTFTVNGTEQTMTAAEAEEAAGRRIFTCYLNTLQMAEEIKAVYHYGDGKTISHTYSLQEYFNYFDAHASSFTEKTLKLVKAVADYGYFAQPYLIELHHLEGKYAEITKHYTESFDYEAIKPEVAGYTFAKGISDSAVTNASYKLSLDSDTALSVFMQVPAGTELTASASFGGKTYAAEKQSDKVYIVKIPGIKASQLGSTITVTGEAGGNFTITVSALSYVRSVLKNDSYGEKAKNTVFALYKYYEAVKNY